MKTFFENLKDRAVMLWLSDAVLGFFTYKYLTSEKKINSMINLLAKNMPDPEALNDPEIRLAVMTQNKKLVLNFLIVFAIIHTLSFYKYSLGNKKAQTYVKFYSLTVVIGVLIWLAFEFEKAYVLTLFPTFIFACIVWYEFFIEPHKQ